MRLTYTMMAVALASASAFASVTTSPPAATRPVGSLEQAKIKWPKIHKCRPIKNGVQCEIKVSQLAKRKDKGTELPKPKPYDTPPNKKEVPNIPPPPPPPPPKCYGPACPGGMPIPRT